jgi:hypothetical protein
MSDGETQEKRLGTPFTVRELVAQLQEVSAEPLSAPDARWQNNQRRIAAQALLRILLLLSRGEGELRLPTHVFNALKELAHALSDLDLGYVVPILKSGPKRSGMAQPVSRAEWRGMLSGAITSIKAKENLESNSNAAARVYNELVKRSGKEALSRYGISNPKFLLRVYRHELSKKRHGNSVDFSFLSGAFKRKTSKNVEFEFPNFGAMVSGANLEAALDHLASTLNLANPPKLERNR